MPAEPDPTPTLFIAQDHEKIVVSTMRPAVTGRAQVTAGPITDLLAIDYPVTVGNNPPRQEMRTSTVSATGPSQTAVAITAALATVAVLCGSPATAARLGGVATAFVDLAVITALITWAVRRGGRVRRRWQRAHVVLRHPDEQATMRAARQAAGEVIGAWPRLHQRVDVPAPGPVLAQTLWSLATVLGTRQTIRATRDELTSSLRDLPADSRIRIEVNQRLAEADKRFREVDFAVLQRMIRLRGLAGRCVAFVRTQEAMEQARRTVRDADQVLGATIVPALDASEPAATELDERTAALLSAYQELTLDLGADDAP